MAKDNNKPQSISEGRVIKGGVSQKPSTPKPQMTPPSQKTTTPKTND